MDIILMRTPVEITITTEDTPVRQQPGPWGTEDVYRIRQISVRNPDARAWSLALYRNGVPVHVMEITAGMERITTIQTNRRFELDEYSVSCSLVR